MSTTSKCRRHGTAYWQVARGIWIRWWQTAKGCEESYASLRNSAALWGYGLHACTHKWDSLLSVDALVYNMLHIGPMCWYSPIAYACASNYILDACYMIKLWIISSQFPSEFQVSFPFRSWDSSPATVAILILLPLKIMRVFTPHLHRLRIIIGNKVVHALWHILRLHKTTVSSVPSFKIEKVVFFL